MQENGPPAFPRLYSISVLEKEKVLRKATASASVQGRYLNIDPPQKIAYRQSLAMFFSDVAVFRCKIGNYPKTATIPTYERKQRL